MTSRSQFEVRMLAATAVLVSGAVHLKLYDDAYRDVPNYMLGRSFLANAVASGVVAVLLVHWRSRWSLLAGLAIAVGTLAAFSWSRLGQGIFGFSEKGLQPAPEVVVALAAEVLAVVVCIYGLARERTVGQSSP